MTGPTPHPLAAEAEQALQGVTKLIAQADAAIWNLRFSARDPETGDDLYPGSFVHLAVEDANQAAAALTALSEQLAALTAQVAELTRERDEALSAARQQDKLREATLGTLRSVSAALDAAEAKAARLEGALRGLMQPGMSGNQQLAARHAARAALTEGDTNG